MEHTNYRSCSAFTAKTRSNQPIQQFAQHRHRDGLMYPREKLLYIPQTLQLCLQTGIEREPRLKEPLKTLLKAAVPAGLDSGPLN
ncbi:hypothetical protein HPB48_012874 [Haemaphysalis longicornis]|uniref:Uncharacterized protein n=1 Tax=Haemaphysalis longicornis TaxID=44386 RepID=A0A9J6GIC4_HAELO|nr:hypothetical protein HPB48_012874 [Haemaphysalis longicornis]